MPQNGRRALRSPSHIPLVSVSALIETAGQFRVDSDGHQFIEISRDFLGQHAAVLAILAHEACHHILGLSSIRATSREENERLTDLVVFICGFGNILLQGYRQVRRVDSRWVTMHLGYLSEQQYWLANNWILRAQGLQNRPPLAPPASLSRRSLFSRVKQWFGPEGATLGQDGHRSIVPSRPLFDVTAQRRRTALARLNGDRALLDRLLDYERRRHPNADDLTLLDAVIESLERDRR